MEVFLDVMVLALLLDTDEEEEGQLDEQGRYYIDYVL